MAAQINLRSYLVVGKICTVPLPVCVSSRDRRPNSQAPVSKLCFIALLEEFHSEGLFDVHVYLPQFIWVEVD